MRRVYSRRGVDELAALLAVWDLANDPCMTPFA